LQLFISGLANGCVYGLIALGFVLIYKATEAVNFAQGDFMMFGAFITLTLTNSDRMDLPFWLAAPLAILIMGVADRKSVV
jgi:branched-chain amino acid transport system permease protein